MRSELAHFGRAIVRGTAPSTQFDVSTHYSLDTSIEVYRNNYRGNLQDALAGAYPVIGKLVGKEFFRMMARHFIEQYPSRSANLFDYGSELADFLMRFAPAKTLVYLPDVAHLEWACHLAYFALDDKQLDLAKLAQIAPEHYPNLILRTHPACRVVFSHYPIATIWQVHQSALDSDFQIDLDSGPSYVLVSRQHDAINVIELDAAEALWLQSVMTGLALGVVTDTTLNRYPHFDLQSTLLKFVSLDVLSDFTLGEQS